MIKQWEELVTQLLGLQNCSVEELQNELVRRLTSSPNPRVGTCVYCKSSIWAREARIQDDRGHYHPLCFERRRAMQAELERDQLWKIIKDNQIPVGIQKAQYSCSIATPPANVLPMRTPTRSLRAKARDRITDLDLSYNW